MRNPNQVLSQGIKPLTNDMRIAGPAFTVKGTRDRYRALATFGTGGRYISAALGLPMLTS